MFQKFLTAIVATTALFGFNANSFATEDLGPDPVVECPPGFYFGMKIFTNENGPYEVYKCIFGDPERHQPIPQRPTE